MIKTEERYHWNNFQKDIFQLMNDKKNGQPIKIHLDLKISTKLQRVLIINRICQSHSNYIVLFKRFWCERAFRLVFLVINDTIIE